MAIDGRLAFIVDPSSDHKPNCVWSVDVSVDKGGPIAKPTAEDDEKLVRNGGVYWWKTLAIGSCENRFPIFYGQPLNGQQFIDHDGTLRSVEAKPLRIGVVYSVDTASSGSRFGQGWFRINKGGRIENFRADPMPSVVNSEGCDVTDYANMAQPADEGTYYPGNS